jgi:hypothetical protein
MAGKTAYRGRTTELLVSSCPNILRRNTAFGDLQTTEGTIEDI